VAIKISVSLTKQNQLSGGLAVGGHRDTSLPASALNLSNFHHHTLYYCISKKRTAGKNALLKL
jgi:hypothetical protein